jgi:hypothetical protein
LSGHTPFLDTFPFSIRHLLKYNIEEVHLLKSNEKSSIFHNTTIYHVAVFIVVASSVSLLIGIGSNQPQITMAQQQQQSQANQTFSPSVEEQQQLLEGISFP